MTKKLIRTGFLFLALAGLLTLGGCNSEIEDPDDSASILNVDKIDPSNLEVETTETTTQNVTITVSATSRVNENPSVIFPGGDPSEFNTVTLDNYSVIYDPPMQSNPPVSVLNYPMTETVEIGGARSIPIIAVSKNQLVDGGGVAPNTQTNVTVVVNGRDALGNPASASGRFYILFKNVGAAIDADNDGILDDGNNSGIVGDVRCTGGNTVNCDDNCQFTVNPLQEDDDSDGIGNVCDPTPQGP